MSSVTCLKLYLPIAWNPYYSRTLIVFNGCSINLKERREKDLEIRKFVKVKGSDKNWYKSLLKGPSLADFLTHFGNYYLSSRGPTYLDFSFGLFELKNIGPFATFLVHLSIFPLFFYSTLARLMLECLMCLANNVVIKILVGDAPTWSFGLLIKSK